MRVTSDQRTGVSYFIHPVDTLEIKWAREGFELGEGVAWLQHLTEEINADHSETSAPAIKGDD